jgi:hypothetical protein
MLFQVTAGSIDQPPLFCSRDAGKPAAPLVACPVTDFHKDDARVVEHDDVQFAESLSEVLLE